MELVKGPAPPQYPGNTISGIVNMTTKTGDEYPGGNLRLTFGRYDQQIYELSAGGGDKAQNYFFAFNRTHEHGWRPQALTNMNDATMKLVFTPDEQSKLTVAGSFLGGEKAGFIADGPNPAGQWGYISAIFPALRPPSPTPANWTRSRTCWSEWPLSTFPARPKCNSGTSRTKWPNRCSCCNATSCCVRRCNTTPGPLSTASSPVESGTRRISSGSPTPLSTSFQGNVPADKRITCSSGMDCLPRGPGSPGRNRP